MAINTQAPVPANETGMGLHIMRYRARMIGGILEIQPNSPAGTVVSCTIDTQSDIHSNSGTKAYG